MLRGVRVVCVTGTRAATEPSKKTRKLEIQQYLVFVANRARTGSYQRGLPSGLTLQRVFCVPSRPSNTCLRQALRCCPHTFPEGFCQDSPCANRFGHLTTGNRNFLGSDAPVAFDNDLAHEVPHKLVEFRIRRNSRQGLLHLGDGLANCIGQPVGVLAGIVR